MTGTPSRKPLHSVKDSKLNTQEPPPKFNIKSLDQFPTTKVEWLWWPWIPLGKVSLLEGESGVGKSTLIADIIARVSTGSGFPATTIDGKRDRRNETHNSLVNKPAHCIILELEDDISDTVRPRLEAQGADLSRISTIEPASRPNPDEASLVLNFPEHYPELREAIRQTNTKLLVIDPIMDFLDEQVKTFSDQSVRKALNPLSLMAAEENCAMLFVRHLNKGSGQSAKQRGSGTGAFLALSRSSFIAAETDDPSINALANNKSNLVPKKDTLSYQIVPSPHIDDISVVQWGESLVNITADDLVKADNRKKKTSRNQCMEIIYNFLLSGPQKSDDVMGHVMDKMDISDKTATRAADDLKVEKVPIRTEDGKRILFWRWSLTEASHHTLTA